MYLWFYLLLFSTIPCFVLMIIILFQWEKGNIGLKEMIAEVVFIVLVVVVIIFVFPKLIPFLCKLLNDESYPCHQLY